MRKPLIGSFVLSLLGTAAAYAGNVYIPVADAAGESGSTHILQVWITNSGTVQRPFSASVLQAETDGTKRPKPPESPVAAGRTTRIGNLGAPGRVALLEIVANSQMTVEARLNSASASGQTSQSAVPVISSENLFEPSETAVLNGLGRNEPLGEHTNLGIVNLGTARSQCVIRAFRSNGTQIGGNISLSFLPLSLRHFPDAFLLLREAQAADGRFEVSCSQPFYAYAEAVSNSQVFYITPSASGASGVDGGGDGGGTPNPTNPGAQIVKYDGLLHTVAQGNEKRRIDINFERAFTVKKLILEMDFTPGPWNRSKSPGNHAIVWLYREKFRGNTIANVNAFAPKSSLKASQNIDLGPGIAEAAEAGVAWQQGKRYHLKYTYDAQIRKVSVELSSGGQIVKRLELPGTSPGGVLDIPSRGLIVEFGHWGFEPGPEVASYGWQYSNLKIEFVP